MEFRTVIKRALKTATGIEVPPSVVAELGTSKKPAVAVTINGYTWRSTVAVMGGAYMVGVSAETRAAAGIEGGDEVLVSIELDDAPRVVSVPPELAAAFETNPVAAEFFETLSYSGKRAHTLPIEAAKTDETRDKRLAASIAMLNERRKS